MSAINYDTLEAIDGMDYYGVQLTVNDYDAKRGRIEISLWKDRSTSDVRDTALYHGEAHYDDEVKWRCVLNDNYAVIDKVLEKLNG